jgi:hypothetical protein
VHTLRASVALSVGLLFTPAAFSAQPKIWVKPGATTDDYRRDNTECEKRAGDILADKETVLVLMLRDELTFALNEQYRDYMLCMKKKGWRQKKSSQAEHDQQNRLPLWPSEQQMKDEAKLKSMEHVLELHTKEYNYNAVIERCNEALRLNPDDAESYSNRGVSYIMKANIDKELNDQVAESWGVNKPISLDPNVPEIVQVDPKTIEHKRSIELVKEGIAEDIARGCHDVQKACELGACKSYEWSKKEGYCRSEPDASPRPSK